MRNAFANTMLSVGKEDPRLVVVVGDISHFALQPFAKACPGRFYNIGILEPTIVSLTAGMSATGLLPVAHTIAPFLIERSLEQIKLDFCYQGLGGTLVSVGSAFDYSGLGCSHHCYNDLALVKGMPNTEVIYPASPCEFETLFRQTYQNTKLTYFRLPGTKHSVEIDAKAIQLGKGIIIKTGRDISILAAGPQLKTVVSVVTALADKRIDAEILYYPTLKPFDANLLQSSVSKTKHLLVVEEHSWSGGYSDEALRAVREIVGCKVEFINIPDEFQRGYGQYEDHLSKLGFTPEGVLEKAVKLVKATS